MTRSRPWRAIRACALGLGACGLGLAVVSCGNTGNTGTTAATPSPVPSLAAQVPQAIRDDGKLMIATDASYPPNEYVDPATQQIVGWNVELGTAVAGKLGLRPEFQNAGFDTIIPGLQSGKYEIGISSFTDNKEREKAVDFVTYYSAGTSWASLKDNPKHVTPDNACGKTVGVQQGTVQVQDVAVRSAACQQAGKPAIQTVVRKQQTEVNADLVAGKTDAMLADSPIVGYVVKQTGGKLAVIGTAYGTAPYGWAIGKNSGTLKDAVLAAVKAIIADGTYQKILDKWGVQQGAITDPVINGARG
ncbi:ABC transporter substrate-binding protein [Acrocarpospora catenulata]|uniref:ABC transporter substrate-binding protein n=1 Tax=Acrocarpospora catenulata TaxID=2836182 RepID=UPI001BD9F744|nr:ABC transporter substrate-binding protein [Acrocarpospora catenulata]